MEVGGIEICNCLPQIKDCCRQMLHLSAVKGKERKKRRGKKDREFLH